MIHLRMDGLSHVLMERELRMQMPRKTIQELIAELREFINSCEHNYSDWELEDWYRIRVCRDCGDVDIDALEEPDYLLDDDMPELDEWFDDDERKGHTP